MREKKKWISYLTYNQINFICTAPYNQKKLISEGAEDWVNRDALMKNKMYALPDNLIEVPPVALQSFMLKYEDKYGGRLESPTAKKKRIDKKFEFKYS